MERIAAMAILNKSIDYANRGKHLEILSATCADNVENYIFIEAFRKPAVFEAIAGLNFCLSKIDVIPLNEMTKIYETQINSGKPLPEPRNWVRIKSGVYDKDLGIVEKIIGDDKMWVKLIPRIDP
jgi:DNA helicase HerA-like ATPase